MTFDLVQAFIHSVSDIIRAVVCARFFSVDVLGEDVHACRPGAAVDQAAKAAAAKIDATARRASSSAAATDPRPKKEAVYDTGLHEGSVYESKGRTSA